MFRKRRKIIKKENVVHIAVPVDNHIFFFCADIYTYANSWGRVVRQVGNA